MERRGANQRPRAGAAVSVTAFVDWGAQMHNAGARASDREGARHTLVRTTRLVERVLKQERPPYRVSFRLYHGWYQGWHATAGYKAAVQAVVDTDFAALSGESVAFSPTVRYGHALLAALPERQHANPPIHLPNTLRRQAREQPPTEKMVDTALATDLLAWARLSPSEWALVLAEDDDLVPPLFAAEAWVKPYGGRALLVRRRPAGQYLKLDGLLRALQ